LDYTESRKIIEIVDIAYSPELFQRDGDFDTIGCLPSSAYINQDTNDDISIYLCSVQIDIRLSRHLAVCGQMVALRNGFVRSNVM